jgi:hypothetical protein
MVISGGTADSSSESEEEELGSAEKDHELSLEEADDKKDEDEKKDEEKPSNKPEAADEGKDNDMKIKGSLKCK